MTRGLFISFEGIDRVGKGTQISLLEEYLIKRNFKVAKGRDPGSTSACEAIRNILLNPNITKEGLEPLTETYLFLAARSEYTSKIVRPSLEDNEIFITDRFDASTRAYQGHGLGVDIDFIDRQNAEATKGLLPDFTFVIDADPQKVAKHITGCEFKGSKADIIEARKLDFHRRVREGFLEYAKIYYYKSKVIPFLEGKVEEMHLQIRECVDRLLNQYIAYTDKAHNQ